MNVRLFKVKKFQRFKGTEVQREEVQRDRGPKGQRSKGLVEKRSNAYIEVLIE